MNADERRFDVCGMRRDKKRKLPEGWKWEKIENIFELKYGSGLPKDLRKKGNFPVFGSNGIVGYNSESITNGSTIIIGRKGSAGEVVWSDVACWPIDTTYYIEELKKKGSLKYIYHALRFLKLSELDKSSAVPGLNRDDVYSIEICLPPTPADQDNIAADLERRMAQVEKMRRAALRQLDAAKAISSAILNEIFSCDVFKNFKLVRLEDWQCEIASGQAVSSVGGTYQKQGIRYIQGNNLTNEGFAFEPVVYIGVETHAAMSRSVIKPKDVLINIVGPPIGKICWYPEDQPEANINQAVVRVHCPDDLDYRFLTYLLRTKKYYDYFFEVKVGVRQWNISRTNCADINIPKVPLSLQRELVKKFEGKISGNPLIATAGRQLEAIEALPGAILREVFDFEEENIGTLRSDENDHK